MQKIVGLDIGSYSVKAVEITNRFKSYEVTNFYEKLIPQIDKDSLEELVPTCMNQLFSENNNVIHIKYENFFLDFENQKKILCSRLNIDPKINDTFDLNFTKNNLFKFKEKLTDDEKRFIDNELKDYV